jgi:DNA topoisomerase-1
MQTLLIVESPAKCAKIVSYLGSGYTCIASFGHIRRLISVDPEDQFKTTFEIINEKQVTKIKKAIKNANEVFLATDDDREGEAIAWHICDVFGLSTDKTKRIKFHEITKPALEHAVRNPTVVDMNLVRAQQSRQIVDMLVGFQVSPVLWRHVSSRKKLSAGRCQTPALRLLYENDKAVQASAGTMQYATTGYFTSLALPFQLNHHYIDAPSITHFLTKSATHEHVLHKQTPQPLLTLRNFNKRRVTSLNSLQPKQCDFAKHSMKADLSLTCAPKA